MWERLIPAMWSVCVWLMESIANRRHKEGSEASQVHQPKLSSTALCYDVNCLVIALCEASPSMRDVALTTLIQWAFANRNYSVSAAASHKLEVPVRTGVVSIPIPWGNATSSITASHGHQSTASSTNGRNLDMSSVGFLSIRSKGSSSKHRLAHAAEELMEIQHKKALNTMINKSLLAIDTLKLLCGELSGTINHDRRRSLALHAGNALLNGFISRLQVLPNGSIFLPYPAVLQK